MSIRKKSGNHFSPKAKRKWRIWIASAVAVALVAVVAAIGISTSWGTISPVGTGQTILTTQDSSSSSDAEASDQDTSAADQTDGGTSQSTPATSHQSSQPQTAALTDEETAAIQQQEEENNSGASDGVIYEPGVVLVPVEPGQTAEDIDAKLEQADGIATKSVDDQDISQGFVRVKTAGDVSVEDAVDQLGKAGLSSQPNFAYSLGDEQIGTGTSMETSSQASDDSKADTASETNDTKLSDAAQNVAGLVDTGIYKAWDIAKSNKKVSVAVLDTGFLTTHEDLKDNIVATYDATVANPANGIAGDVSDVTDLMGHGTHVAGIVSAEADNGKGVAGVSYNAGIVGVKIFPSYDVRDASTETNKRLPHCYTDDIVYAYKYVLANQSRYNIKVINMSIFGVGMSSDSPKWVAQDKLLASEIQQAYDAGIVSVCCAGNYNPYMDEDASSTQRFMPYDDTFPGDLDAPIVSVMNAYAPDWGPHDIWSLNGSSNFNTVSQTEGKTHKNICAPGSWILSSINTGDDQYQYYSGTSMASPWVAGVVALEFASNPNLTPAQAIQYLYDSATDMTHYGTGWDRYTGYGLVNAYRAVLLASGSNAKRDISEATVEALPIQLLSNGKACEPTPTVMFGYQKLREGTDYTVSYSKNTEVGYGATITVTGIGNYTGTTSSYFAIADSVPDLATSSSVDISCFTSLYDARSADHPINVGIAINTSSNYIFYLQKGIDFDYTLSDAGSDGNVNVSITGKGIFAGQNFSKKMKVSGGTDISSLRWNEIGDQAYTGKPATPIPHIFTDGNYRLSQGVDYTLSYENNVNVGTAKVTVTGKGAFTGTKTVEFKIVGPTDISASSTIKAKISRDTYTYTGSPIEPTVTVTETKPNDEPESLQCQMEGIDSPDYKASFESNVHVGTGYIVVTGINGYTGTIRVPFKIEPADISGATIETIPAQIYTGSALTPSVTVKLGGRTLAVGTDYTVSYSNNVEPGTATVTLTGIGNYTGSVSTTFTINYTPAAGTVPMFRLYNRWSGEHLFTTSKSEYDHLASIGWNPEGIAWTAPEMSSHPVYRLYNPYSGDHFYTGDQKEYDHLESIGWNKEGRSFYSADSSTGKPIYRLFNRWLTQGTHLFTTSKSEYDHLGSIGWNPEYIAFYGLK
ncbi:MAG: hypothetical protein DUD31_06975 [Coriobacteriaceae bacterium]|nr:MAG: hypothetical protein DUD31_06975 [Coriobacteriaceae bacterium]